MAYSNQTSRPLSGGAEKMIIPGANNHGLRNAAVAAADKLLLP